MFQCERCGSSYSATHIGVEHCPRCQLRDQVEAPLAFKVFQLQETRSGTAPGAGRHELTAPAQRDG